MVDLVFDIVGVIVDVVDVDVDVDVVAVVEDVDVVWQMW